MIEILIVFVLILINGLFSMSEMAIVSAKKNRLMAKAEDGDFGAIKALDLADNPNRFLATVQIGITLIGILSGAFGGATIAEKLGSEISKVSWLAPYREAVAVGIVVLVITFLSLVIGELVPKRLALSSAEKIAVIISPLMDFLSKLTTPLVVILSGSTNFILRIFGVRISNAPDVTEEDLRSMLDQGAETGIIEVTEQDMVERIFRLSDRSVSALMTPRTDMIFLDIDATNDEIFNKITRHPFSRFPVIQKTSDNVLGIAQARDLLLQRIEGKEFDIYSVLQQPLFFPESVPALIMLEKFRSTGIELAVVIDEFGGVMGLVSMNDILEAIVGDVVYPENGDEMQIVRREDGSWLLDGLLQVDELKDYLDIDDLPEQDEANYETLGGLMMAYLGRVPSISDFFVWKGFRFEVVDMDGRRVDKVLVSKET